MSLQGPHRPWRTWLQKAISCSKTHDFFILEGGASCAAFNECISKSSAFNQQSVTYSSLSQGLNRNYLLLKKGGKCSIWYNESSKYYITAKSSLPNQPQTNLDSLLQTLKKPISYYRDFEHLLSLSLCCKEKQHLCGWFGEHYRKLWLRLVCDLCNTPQNIHANNPTSMLNSNLEIFLRIPCSKSRMKSIRLRFGRLFGGMAGVHFI